MYRLKTLVWAHPGWSSFVFLACIMAPFTLFEVRNAPMDLAQRFWIAVASIAVAAFCGWVISLAATRSDSA